MIMRNVSGASLQYHKVCVLVMLYTRCTESSISNFTSQCNILSGAAVRRQCIGPRGSQKLVVPTRDNFTYPFPFYHTLQRRFAESRIL